MELETRATNRLVVRILTVALLGGALLSSSGCFMTMRLSRWCKGRPVRTWADGGQRGVYFKIADCEEYPDGWYVYRDGSLYIASKPSMWLGLWGPRYPKHKVRSRRENNQLIQKILRKESKRAEWVRKAEIRLTRKRETYKLRRVIAEFLVPLTIFIDAAVITLGFSLLIPYL